MLHSFFSICSLSSIELLWAARHTTTTTTMMMWMSERMNVNVCPASATYVCVCVHFFLLLFHSVVLDLHQGEENKRHFVRILPMKLTFVWWCWWFAGKRDNKTIKSWPRRDDIIVRYCLLSFIADGCQKVNSVFDQMLRWMRRTTRASLIESLWNNFSLLISIWANSCG